MPSNCEKLAALKRLASGFKPGEVSVANATSRSGGAIGKGALVPKLARRMASKQDRILDFGAGKTAQHTQQLRQAGYNVTAHDFGDNSQPGIHDPNALKREYDLVFASNVLNVQSSPEMLNKTLGQIAGATKPGKAAIANFPASPRKNRLSAAQVVQIARRKFRQVDQVGGSSDAPILKLTK